jgi:hypothetical protein
VDSYTTLVSFQVLTLTGMKMAVFRNVAVVMEVVSFTETPVNFYQTTRRNIREDSHLLFKLILENGQ